MDRTDPLILMWRRHEAINRHMLAHIPDEGLTAVPLLRDGKPGRGRDVARALAHMIDVRMSAMRMAEVTVAGGFKGFDKGAQPGRAELEDALAASSAAVEARYANAVAAGEPIRKHPPAVWLGYLVSHESHHRGQIMLALKQNGVRYGDELRWGIWELWFK